MTRGWYRLGLVVALSAAMAALVAVMHDSMIYFPTRRDEPEELRRAAAAGLTPWRDAQGGIVGWRRVNPPASARLVVFHGNAGSALDRAHYADAFGPLGWEVSIFEYPGYGARSGRPGKDAFFAAGRVAIAGLSGTDQRPIALLGESIGSATACAILEEYSTESRAGVALAGAALVVPFARLSEVAWSHYGPLALLLRDRFDNVAALRACRYPVVFVVAEQDEVVGPKQGRKLHSSFSGSKLLIELPGCSHNDFELGPAVDWVRAVDAFLRGGWAAS